MTNKGKLKKAERLEISILLRKDYSFREIGQALGRSPNTIANEAKRNSTSVFKKIQGEEKREKQNNQNNDSGKS